ncbi:hypothetical protein GALMADRAFT_445471 [Galerina marginata CBS 339.88]|uniref:Uncharacterized protein n=1 Tax=Galerina marginata (strain CBS 339.88) TaxID=685588 RepID=A0A067T011_GALM3|nr:hypothetical protein GALMADRAFT_445471 [Galerina marginata CBS 339.88]
MPTPPSPTDTLPGLAQSASNSASNSSSSPPEPTTPPPRVNRSRTRYPDLGRVPLHRRGTSKTYERLEDLLKEAGYKETRIFTPETERADADGDATADGEGTDNRLSVVKDGMDAVVGFFAGLLPSATASKTNLSSAGESTAQYTTSPQDYSPPASPLAQRYTQKQPPGRGSFDMTEPPTPTTIMTSSIDSLGDPTPKANRQPTSRSTRPASALVHSNTHPPSAGIRDPSHLSYHPMQKQTSRGSISRSSQLQAQVPPYTSPNPNAYLNPSPNPNANFSPNLNLNHIASPRPSRAGAYLRHVASSSSMALPAPARPSSTPVHLFSRDPRSNPNRNPNAKANRSRSTLLPGDSDSEGSVLTYHRQGNGEGEDDGHEPPLPPTWLETVARAVLFGGTGAYIGGPAQAQAQSGFVAAHAAGPSSSKVGKGQGQGQGQVLRQTRSSLSQASTRSKYSQRPTSGLSDQTNTTASGGNGTKSPSFLLPPPPLFTQLERGRAGGSLGEVALTRVVCRSAPGSRSGSVVRGSGVGLGEAKERWLGIGRGGQDKDKDKGNERRRGRQGKRGDEKNRVPSLARTHVEGDVWSAGRRRRAHGAYGHGHSASSSSGRHAGGWGVGADGESADSEDSEGVYYDCEDEDEDEEEDGELDLARILVPPKRQNSIKSLRKHLATDGAAPPPPSSTGAQGKLQGIARVNRGMSVGGGGPAPGPGPRGVGPTAPPSPAPGLLRRRTTGTKPEMEVDGDPHWDGEWARRARERGGRSSEEEDRESFGAFLGFGGHTPGEGRSKGGGGGGRGFNSPWAAGAGVGS